MTNPGEDAGQSASSGSDAGGSEPPSTSYEAPPIEQAQDPAGQAPDDITAVYRTPSFDQPAPTSEPPAYTPPPAYDPSGYQAPPPSYEQPPSYPQGGFPPPADQPGFAPPTPPSYSPPPPPPQYGGAGGFGAPGYPPPPPPYGAPPPGFGPPPPGFGPPPGYQAPGYNAYGQAPAQKTNTMAIGSLVASVVGFCCGIGSIVGIVLGVLAMNQIKQTGENGNSLAIAGIAVGVLSLLINIVWTIGAFAS
jgi:hypothetical protein